MVDDAGRDHLHVEVGHLIGPHHHGTLLFVKGIDNLLQRVIPAVYIIAVELHGKLAALSVVYAHVPAPTDAQVVSLRDDVYQSFVIIELRDGFRGAVCGVIVYDDQVKRKTGFLSQHRGDGVTDSSDAVAHRDDDRCLYRKDTFVKFNVPEFGFQVSAHIFQVLRAGLFHL